METHTNMFESDKENLFPSNSSSSSSSSLAPEKRFIFSPILNRRTNDKFRSIKLDNNNNPHSSKAFLSPRLRFVPATPPPSRTMKGGLLSPRPNGQTQHSPSVKRVFLITKKTTHKKKKGKKGLISSSSSSRKSLSSSSSKSFEILKEEKDMYKEKLEKCEKDLEKMKNEKNEMEKKIDLEKVKNEKEKSEKDMKYRQVSRELEKGKMNEKSLKIELKNKEQQIETHMTEIENLLVSKYERSFSKMELNEKKEEITDLKNEIERLKRENTSVNRKVLSLQNKVMNLNADSKKSKELNQKVKKELQIEKEKNKKEREINENVLREKSMKIKELIICKENGILEMEELKRLNDESTKKYKKEMEKSLVENETLRCALMEYEELPEKEREKAKARVQEIINNRRKKRSGSFIRNLFPKKEDGSPYQISESERLEKYRRIVKLTRKIELDAEVYKEKISTLEKITEEKILKEKELQEKCDDLLAENNELQNSLDEYKNDVENLLKEENEIMSKTGFRKLKEENSILQKKVEKYEKIKFKIQVLESIQTKEYLNVLKDIDRIRNVEISRNEKFRNKYKKLLKIFDD